MKTDLRTVARGSSLLILLGSLSLTSARVEAGEPAVRSGIPLPAGERATLPDASTNRSAPAREEKPRLRLTSSPQSIHGGIQIPLLVVVGESNKFAFLPPNGWRVGSDAVRKRIQLTRPQSGSTITVDLVEASAGQTVERSPEVLLPRILSRFSNAKVVEQLSLSGMGGMGPALDLEWRTPSGSLRRARAGVIPFAGGYLECALTGSPDTIVQDLQSLNRLLLSFRQAPLNGKLDLPIVTPE